MYIFESTYPFFLFVQWLYYVLHPFLFNLSLLNSILSMLTLAPMSTKFLNFICMEDRPVVPRSAGGAMEPPEGILCLPNDTGTPRFSDLPTTQEDKTRFQVLTCFVFVFNRGDTVSRRSPIKGVRPSPYTTLWS